MGHFGEEMYTFLQNTFYFQPNIRLPFPILLTWIQLEIHHKNLEFAMECLIKPYIAQSNKFKSLESKKDQELDIVKEEKTEE